MSKDKVYHIYAKDTVLYSNLSEAQFNVTWRDLTLMVGLLRTDYNENDLTYEELTVQHGLESSY